MRTSIAVLLILVSNAVMAGAELSFAEAKKVWETSKDTKAYQLYLGEFAQFNNHFRIDEKDGCYAQMRGPVELLLVLTHDGKSQYAKIEQVLSNVDNAKASCFKKSYSGVPTKIPPFLPFVIQMNMG